MLDDCVLEDAPTNAPPSLRAWTGPVPTLFRFLVILGVLAGLVYGGMVALVANVKVEPREMTQNVAIPKAPK
jgi:hypothetical protein